MIIRQFNMQICIDKVMELIILFLFKTLSLYDLRGHYNDVNTLTSELLSDFILMEFIIHQDLLFFSFFFSEK